MKLSEFLQRIGSPVAFYPRLVEFLGSIQSALFLCQFGYWEGKQSDKEGWIYKTQDEIKKETGLSRSGQETARRKLRAKGYLNEKQKGIPKQLYYKFNWDLLNENWEVWAEKRFNTSPSKSSKQECENEDHNNDRNLQTINTESTTQQTTAKKYILRTAKTPSAHTQFISFWIKETQMARNIIPTITGKDGKNLKRVLGLGIDEQVIEQAAVYFLSHHSFKEFPPNISTLLSAGVLNGILNRMQNGENFWKELNGYVEKRNVAVPRIKYAEHIGKMRAGLGLMASTAKNKTAQ